MRFAKTNHHDDNLSKTTTTGYRIQREKYKFYQVFFQTAMLSKLIFLFVVIPLADLAMLLYLSTKMGWQTSLALVIGSGVLGAWKLRRSFRNLLQQMGQASDRPVMSLQLLSDGAMLILAAGLLLTPGFITDFVGFALLFPSCRQLGRTLLAAWLQRNIHVEVKQASFNRWFEVDDVVEGSFSQPQEQGGQGGQGQPEHPKLGASAEKQSGKLLD